MKTSRREFLATSSAATAAILAGARAEAQTATPVPGAPPAFGTAPAAGPEITAATFAEAEKLMRVTLSPKDRMQAAGSWPTMLAGTMERRTGPKKVPLEASLAPASRWNPLLPGI